MKLPNPCSISELIRYCDSVQFTDDNDYINQIYVELNRISSEHIEKRIIASTYKLLHYTAGEDSYIDIGCLILAIMTLTKNIYHNIVVDLKTGSIGVTENTPKQMFPDLKKISEISNCIKQIIVNQFNQGCG